MKNFLPICPNHFAAKILTGKLCFLVSAALFCFNNNLLAQAPTISYSSPPAYTVGQTITTLTPSVSGVAAAGYAAAVIKGSGFNTATGIAADAAGNVYASYDAGNTVYKIKATGGLAAVGTGFNNPQGIAVDAAGDVFVADAGNNAVKEVLASNGSTIVIGSGFNKPSDVAVDAAGNLFIADLGNGEVKMIPAGGTTPVLISSGFYQPTGIAVDAYDNFYVTDTETGSISMTPLGGAKVTIGSGISNPYGIAVDCAGNVYIASTTGTSISEIPAGGGSTINLGSGFSAPKGVVINGAGNLYVADTGNGDIKSLAPTGGFFISPELPQGLTFNNATGAISGTPVMVSSATNYTVSAYNSSGLATAMLSVTVRAAAVTISYTSPVSYLVNKAITPLVPTESGSVNLAYRNAATATILASALNDPFGAAVDAAGNVYVASFHNTEILKITPGSGISVYATGFTDPFSIAIDAAGNLYVGDQSAIKKIPVGGGTPVLISSAFSQPFGIAVDAAGNLYIADTNSALVSELPAGGGNPVTITSAVSEPYGVAVDAAGNVYIASSGDGTVKEVPAGGGSIFNIASGLSDPTGLAADAAGNIYVSANGSNDIVIVTPGNGEIFTAVSDFSNRALAVDSKGNIYAADQADNEIKEVIPVGGYFLSNPLPQGLNFNSINGEISGTPTVAGPAANYAVTAYNTGASATATFNLQIRTIAPAAFSFNNPPPYVVGQAITPLSPATSQGVSGLGYNTSTVAMGSGFSSPTGVAADAAGNIYIADEGNNAVKKIPAGGGSPVTIGSGFSLPDGVAVDAAGNVYVADKGNHAVKKIPSGSGTPVLIGTGFSSPIGIAVDAAGNVYVGDVGLNAVMKIQAVGGATVAIGSGFNDPYGVAVDAAGNVYVADEANGALKEIQAAGGATVTLASGLVEPTGVAVDAIGDLYVTAYGSGTVTFYPNNGSASSSVGSGFTHPYGLAVDWAGNVYVADIGKTVIEQVAPDGGYFVNKPLPAGLSFDDGDGTFSGTPTAPSPATAYTVIGYNAGGGTPVNVTLSVLPSSDATLSNLAISNGTLTPAFAVATTSYAASVGNGLASMTITPTASDPTATIKVNGITVASGNASQSLPLVVGPNTITTVVTAQDGVTTKTYTLVVTEAKSSNDNLSAFKPSTGSLTPTFAAATISYAESVANSVASITITPTTAATTSTVTINGTAVTSGTASAPITLNVGANSITGVVTAQNGATKTYTLTVTRAAGTNVNLSSLAISNGTLTPVFAGGTTSYTASVGNGLASMTITPTAADPTTTITVNGKTVTSGSASQSLPLVVGPNTITTVVTATDGVTKKTYTLVVTEAKSSNDNLSAFKPGTGSLTPTFAAATTSYTENVANTVSTMTITPTTAVSTSTVTINGTKVTSGTASTPITLSVGANTITGIVTAQNGATKTYTLTVTRAAAGADSYDPIAIGAGISVIQPTEKPQIADDGITVHQAISPNGDGINDFLQIDNISQYPDNKLSIMNRNGQLIYEAQGYDNSSKVFDGHSNKNGQMQLPGTYFYQLDYTANGITKHKTGFLVLKY